MDRAEGSKLMSEHDSNASTGGSMAPKIVACPNCKGDSIYATSNPYRPFCSERCKMNDFGAWASESFRIPANEPTDDLEAGAPPLQ